VEVKDIDITCTNHAKLVQKDFGIQAFLGLQPNLTHLRATKSLPQREKLHDKIQPSRHGPQKGFLGSDGARGYSAQVVAKAAGGEDMERRCS